jgi:hypothetical protein
MIIDKTKIDAIRETQAASILWIHTMSHKDKWNLTSNEIADLLGLPVETYQDILQRVTKKESIDLKVNTLERLSLLLGIWKCLQAYGSNRQNRFSLFCI